jgi:hypothetical protein
MTPPLFGASVVRALNPSHTNAAYWSRLENQKPAAKTRKNAEPWAERWDWFLAEPERQAFTIDRPAQGRDL